MTPTDDSPPILNTSAAGSERKTFMDTTWDQKRFRISQSTTWGSWSFTWRICCTAGVGRFWTRVHRRLHRTGEAERDSSDVSAQKVFKAARSSEGVKSSTFSPEGYKKNSNTCAFLGFQLVQQRSGNAITDSQSLLSLTRINRGSRSGIHPETWADDVQGEIAQRLHQQNRKRETCGRKTPDKH